MRLLASVLGFLLAVVVWPVVLLVRGVRRMLRRPFQLAVSLRGDLPWRLTGLASLGLWRRPPAPRSLRELSEKLRLAAADPKVAGLVVRVEGMTCSGARLDALRDHLERFRASGKPLVGYGRVVDGRELGLLAAAGKIQMAPGGRVGLSGRAAELVVLGETLSRLGVKAHFVRRSEHKTAPELFTDRTVSAAQRESIHALLSEAVEAEVASVARGRKRSVEEARRWLEEGPYSSARAVAAGMVDSEGDGEDLEVSLAPVGRKRARMQALGTYSGVPRLWPRLPRLRRQARVGVVPIAGLIGLGDSVKLPAGPRFAGSDTIARVLRRVREDSSLRAVVLDIDSRGGSALASGLMLRSVKRLAEAKPTVAWIERVAASGGYMAAVGASRIVAAPRSVVGSIGVFGGKFEISGLLDKLGVGREVLRLGRNAALFSSFLPWTDEERAVLEREIDEAYRDFLSCVAAGRKMSLEQVEPLAGGRIYSGTRGLQAGLVDAVGSFEDAVASAASLAGIAGEPEVVAIDPVPGPFASLSRLRAAAGQLRSLFSERVFAAAEWWVEVR